MRWIALVALVVSAFAILETAPAPASPRDAVLAFLLAPDASPIPSVWDLLSQPSSAWQMEQARLREAAYAQWRWFDRYDEFARAHNLFRDAVVALLEERQQGILDAKFTKARTVDRRKVEMERRWAQWRRCEGWPDKGELK